MTFQRRNLILLGLFASALLALAWIAAREVLLGEFLRLEERDHALHIRQLHQLLAGEQSYLLAQAQDWAAWDETYRFVAEPSEAYLQSSFAAGGLALEGLDLDLLVIVDREGKTVYGEVIYEADRLQTLPPGEVFHPYFQDPLFLEKTGGASGVTGYVMKNDRPLLLAAYPVLTSQNLGPSRGAVVMGRFLDEAQIAAFADRFQYPLGWSRESRAEGTVAGEDAYVYHLALPVLDGAGAGTLFFTERREIARQGEQTVRVLLGYFAAATLGMIGLLYFLQERYLFARIRALSTQLERIPAVLSEPCRIKVEDGGDEVGSLAARINAMLQGLYEKRQQELQLNRQERLAAMGKVVAIIAHEWRQPLNLVGVILQNFKCAYEDKRLDEAYLDAQIGLGMTELLKMSATIDEFGRIYRPVTHKERFDLKALAQKAIDLTTARSAAKTAVTLEGEGIVIEGYASEFLQAAIALLQNAQEAIEARAEPQGRIAVRVFREGGLACLSVEDNGGGIDAALMEQIFEPYFSTKGVMQGVGNGLFMVKMAVERGMGGKVTVENIPGGVRATLCLPPAQG